MEFYQLCLIGPRRNYPSVEPRINYITFFTEKFFLSSQNLTTISLFIYVFWTSCELEIVQQVLHIKHEQFHVPNLHKTCKSTNNWLPKVGYGSVSYSISCNMVEERVKKSGKLMKSFMFWYAELAEQFQVHNLFKTHIDKEIIVKFWLKSKNFGSVSYSFSFAPFEKMCHNHFLNFWPLLSVKMVS